MFKKSLSIILFLGLSFIANAQKTNFFYGRFHNAEQDIRLVLDLYQTSISLPGLEFLGKTNGYMYGRLYSTWYITSVKLIDDSKAEVHFSNDQGADFVVVRFTAIEKNSISYEIIGTNNVKKVVGRKLVKVPTKMVFKRE